MKKYLLFVLCALSLNTLAQSHDKPTLMILPSDHWCTMRYFTQTFNNQGSKVIVCDYQRAFQEDTEIRSVIAKVGQLLAEQGYQTKDCEQELKNINIRQAEDAVTMSSTSGASIMESPLDVLKRRTKSDIVIQLDWEVNGSAITFTVEGFDSFTNKRIATSTGTISMSKDPIAKQLESCIKKNMKEFSKQLLSHFNEQKRNGREIKMTILVWDSWDGNLESEYDDEELIDHIRAWMRKNTVEKSFHMTDNTETKVVFEQVRIPFCDEEGDPVDARSLAVKLRKHLAKAPFEITSKVMTQGIGEVTLILGEK